MSSEKELGCNDEYEVQNECIYKEISWWSSPLVKIGMISDILVRPLVLYLLKD
jgi:hypothetical protein